MVRLPQVALPLGRLLGEDVALVGVAALVLAGSGLPEALGRRPIGLDLGHWESLRNQLTGRGGSLRCSLHPAWPVCKPLIRGESGRVLGATGQQTRRTGPHIMAAACRVCNLSLRNQALAGLRGLTSSSARSSSPSAGLPGAGAIR